MLLRRNLCVLILILFSRVLISAPLQIIITIAGRGKVGDGARQACDELGVKWIKASELEKVATTSGTSRGFLPFLNLTDLPPRRGRSARAVRMPP